MSNIKLNTKNLYKPQTFNLLRHFTLGNMKGRMYVLMNFVKIKFFEYIDNQFFYLCYAQELHYGVAIYMKPC